MKNRLIPKLLALILSFILLISGGCIKSDTAHLSNNGIEYLGYGANRTVSGSLHILNIDGEKLILDAGSFYGDEERQAEKFPEEMIKDISAIILSHAHLDHIGRLLHIIDMGYTGPIYCTSPTKELMPVMLSMTAKYDDFGQEDFYYSEVSYKNNKGQDKNTAVHIYKECQYGAKIKPYNRGSINSSRDKLEEQGFYVCGECARHHVQMALDLVETLPLRSEKNITENISIELFNTPHLPGSVMMKLESKRSGQSILFTGDLGSGVSPYLPEQDVIEAVDYAIIEGTYGTDSTSISAKDREEFRKYLGECVNNKKRIIIPAFVLDRSQQVLFEITQGMKEGYIPPNTPIKVFSPSTAEINRIYSQVFTQTEFAPFFSTEYSKTGPFENIFKEYKLLEDVGYGEIAIASSGMADNIYSKEFVKQWIADPDTVFIFVGYQDPDTIGGKMTDSESLSSIEIDLDKYEVKAKIKKFSCFSSHGNYNQIKNLLSDIDNLKKVLVVHVDERNVDELIDNYKRDFPGIEFLAPESGVVIPLNKKE